MQFKMKATVAPEIRLLGGSCSQASDIYSYGVILAELATPQAQYRKGVDVLARVNSGATEYDEIVPTNFIKVLPILCHQ